MGNFNKVLSFILGLVVVIVFVIVLSKRLNLQNKFIPFGNNLTPTPKVEKTAQETSKESSGQDQTKEPAKGDTTIKFTQPEEQKGEEVVNQVQSIPETGPSSLLLLVYAASGATGFYLLKFKK